MRKIWLFKNSSNFAIGMIGIFIPGYFGFTMYKQSLFQNPIVDESMNILSKNKQIKAILGFPISYQSRSNSDAFIEKQKAFYSFTILGPKGHLDVQAVAQAKILKDVYDPKSILKLKQEIRQNDQELIQLKQKKRFKEQLKSVQKQKQKIIRLEKEIQSLRKQIINCENGKIDLQNEKKTIIKKNIETYYIPDKQNLDIVNKNFQSNQFVSEELKVWGITKLIAELPNRNKIIIIPKETNNNNQPATTIQQPQKLTYKSVYKKLNRSDQILETDQILQYSKHKTNVIYSKYNSQRMFGFFATIIIVAGIIVFKSKNKLIKLENSVLVYETKQLVENHPSFKKSGKWIWRPVIKGGQVGKDADFEIDSISPIAGTLKVSASYIQKNQNYKLQTVQFKTKNKQRQQILNLLKKV